MQTRDYLPPGQLANLTLVSDPIGFMASVVVVYADSTGICVAHKERQYNRPESVFHPWTEVQAISAVRSTQEDAF